MINQLDYETIRSILDNPRATFHAADKPRRSKVDGKIVSSILASPLQIDQYPFADWPHFQQVQLASSALNVARRCTRNYLSEIHDERVDQLMQQAEHIVNHHYGIKESELGKLCEGYSHEFRMLSGIRNTESRHVSYHLIRGIERMMRSIYMVRGDERLLGARAPKNGGSMVSGTISQSIEESRSACGIYIPSRRDLMTAERFRLEVAEDITAKLAFAEATSAELN